MRRGSSIQPAVFQLRIRPSPHSRSRDLGEACGGAPRQRAERVAVEVDDAVGQREFVAQRRERVGAVERDAVVAARERRSGRKGDRLQ